MSRSSSCSLNYTGLPVADGTLTRAQHIYSAAQLLKHVPCHLLVRAMADWNPGQDQRSFMSVYMLNFKRLHACSCSCMSHCTLWDSTRSNNKIPLPSWFLTRVRRRRKSCCGQVLRIGLLLSLSQLPDCWQLHRWDLLDDGANCTNKTTRALDYWHRNGLQSRSAISAHLSEFNHEGHKGECWPLK